MTSFNGKTSNEENKGADEESKENDDDAGSKKRSKSPVTKPRSLSSIGKQSSASRLSSIGLPKVTKAKEAKQRAIHAAIQSKEVGGGAGSGGMTRHFVHLCCASRAGGRVGGCAPPATQPLTITLNPLLTPPCSRVWTRTRQVTFCTTSY